MSFFSSKRRLVAAVALLLLVLFLLRPGASRLKSRIILSISSAVGRPVDVGSVHLRLLPRPGFDLDNLVVYDDPAFGAEPMLRAGAVTAALRLTSLMRGRVEIARLDLTEPSLNLVHGTNGRWNVEALLERTAHTPLAPTGKAKSEPRPGFPYIAATAARINFKSGPEKKPYALTNADFALWQESENAWGVRLKAQPFRTDLNLNDTGILQVNGTWQRAELLRDTPLQFSVVWTRAQLGQLTKFFAGNDLGWRGGAELEVTLAGTPAKLQVTSDASIEDFRRYDIASGSPLRLRGHCTGRYSSMTHEFDDLVCNAPVGKGMITLNGEMGISGSNRFGLALVAESVPASALVVLAQRAKKDLAEDLAANGTLSGRVSIEQNASTGARLLVEGHGEIAELRLSSAASKTEIGPETVPFVLTTGDSSAGAAARRAAHKFVPEMRVPEGARMEFGPLPMASGRTTSPILHGWVNRSGYNVSVNGETEIARALRVARMFGIPTLQATTQGSVQVDLQVVGSWAEQGTGGASGFSGPQVSGTAQLRNVSVMVRGTAEPVEVTSAELQLSSERVVVEKLNAMVANTLWTGSLEMPRGCGRPGACEVHFNLSAKEIGLSDLSAWVKPQPKERPWYRALEANAPAGTSFFAGLRASGRLKADSLQMQSVTATHLSANVSLDGGNLRISELEADVLGGKHRGAWQADFGGKAAVCSGSGNFGGISLARVAEAMKDEWMTGTANASYEVAGPCPAEFWQTAEGTVQFEMIDGALPHIVLGEDLGPLQVKHLSGKAHLHSGRFEVKDARVDSPSGKFQLSGTATLQRELDLKLARTSPGAASGYTITGNLAAPRVVQLSGSETQARLKP